MRKLIASNFVRTWPGSGSVLTRRAVSRKNSSEATMLKPQYLQPRIGRLWLALAALALAALACNMGEPEPLYTPEKPTQYTAEVQPPTEVYVLLDEAGNVVDFGEPHAYGATASLRYVLTFWDVGNRMEGYGEATISRVYTPLRITAISQEFEEKLTDEQKSEVYARSAFPTTTVKLHTLEFSGGPEGNFAGANSETGKMILGHMEWREKEWEMHAVFTEDIQQDYLVIADEPFYNWP